MKLRDNLNTEEVYNENIKYYKQTIDNIWYAKIKEIEECERKGIQYTPNKSNKDVIISTYGTIIDEHMEILLATYSAGKEIGAVKDEYLATIDLLLNTTHDYRCYYVERIWLLSIGIMFDIDDEKFQALANYFSKHISDENDYLVDYLINYRIPSWRIKSKDFYDDRPYAFLGKVVSSAQSGDLDQSKKYMQEYITKKWYRGHSDTAWYNDHTEGGPNNPHTGYWSFESGALVKILGLDDSGWEDLQYYPYDMVHWRGNRTIINK